MVDVHAESEAACVHGVLDSPEDFRVVRMRLNDLDGPRTGGDDVLKVLVFAHAEPVDGVAGLRRLRIDDQSVPVRDPQMRERGGHDGRVESLTEEFEFRRRDVAVQIPGFEHQRVEEIAGEGIRVARLGDNRIGGLPFRTLLLRGLRLG